MSDVHNYKHSLVVFYDVGANITKISRFNDASKAKKALFDSLLIGMHAEIVATDVSYEEAQSLIYAHRKSIGSAEIVPKKPRKISPRKPSLVITKPYKVRTREETNDYGTYTVNTIKVRLIPGI